MISTKAVALRLEAGSDEAGYLAQIFPLPKTPTVVMMKHGELKEYIAAGTTREDFFRRVASAFSSGAPTATTSTPSTPSPAPAPAVSPAAPTSSPAIAELPSTAPPPATPPARSPVSDVSDNVRRVLAERAAKAQRENAERQAKAAATAAKGKGKAVSEAAAVPVQTEAQKEASELLKKKKAQENEERRRILKRIEDDKEARRLQAAQRIKQREEDRAAEDAEAKEQQREKGTASRGSSGSSSAAAVAAIQVRLSDGSTLRSKFPATGTVKDIRAWVDKDRSDGQGPYLLKQILTPLPNKNIDTTEEGKSIRELGLSPSSTLLVIPIQKFAAAYEGGQAGSSTQGFVGQILALIVGFFTWILSLVGMGGQRPLETQAAESQPPANSAAALRNRRVQAFQNANDGRGDQQLYNGNSVSQSYFRLLPVKICLQPTNVYILAITS